MENKTRTSTQEQMGTAKLMPCWNCGEQSTQFKRWYHGDQDDLVCLECSKKLNHNDTAYAGLSVDKTMDIEVVTAGKTAQNKSDDFCNYCTHFGAMKTDEDGIRRCTACGYVVDDYANMYPKNVTKLALPCSREPQMGNVAWEYSYKHKAFMCSLCGEEVFRYEQINREEDN